MKILNPIQEISFKQEVDERQAEYNAYIQRQDTTFEEYKVVRGNLYTAYAKYIVFDIMIPCLWIGIIGILFIIIEMLFLFINQFGRTIKEFGTHSIVVDTETMDEYYKIKGLDF